jgi:hypothetical protein
MSTTYTWPPARLPAVTPTTFWYTPLLLTSRVPERLEARIPCELPPALAESPKPTTVLATTRSPSRSAGLVVTRQGDEMTVTVGDTVLVRRPIGVAGSSGRACTHRLGIDDRKWSLESGSGVRVGGQLRRMPIVNGLFSSLDLRSEVRRPTVAVTTRAHRVVPTNRQALAWTAAAICALLSLALVISAQRSGRRHDIRGALIRVKTATRSVDVFVVGALAAWWIIAPSFFDDGWTIVRQTGFDRVGGFSQYYEAFGVNLPLGYWLEWSQHWLTESTSGLMWLRVPALLCLCATWIVCRWIFEQIRRPLQRGGAAGHWSLAAAFVVMSMAWGMSLRQEPAVALLVAGAMACCVRFFEVRSTASLAGLALIVPLALTAHPAGVIALAPVVALLSLVVTWARSNAAPAVAMFTAAGALTITLSFVGADTASRSLDAQTMSAFSVTVADWREELSRYDLVAGIDVDGLIGYATPLRRAAVALMLLSCLAYFVRRSRERAGLLDLPTRALLIALLLLTVTPSKWPWHFGALVALVSLSVAAETLRLKEQDRESSGWQAGPFVAIGALVATILWCWSPRSVWNAVDLRTLDWTPAFERVLPLGTLAAALPLALLILGVVRANRLGVPARLVPPAIVTRSAALLALPLIIFTVGVLTLDALRTPAWTPPRANLSGALGRTDCGLADDVIVPTGTKPLPPLSGEHLKPEPSWLPHAPFSDAGRFLLSSVGGRKAATPWFASNGEPVGLSVLGRPGATDRLTLEWGRESGASAGRTLRPQRIPIRHTSDSVSAVSWKFVAASQLREPPRGATRVRIVYTSDSRDGGMTAVTGPVSYRTEPLARWMRDGRPTLVHPHLLTMFPCADLPILAQGSVEPPGLIVTTSDVDSPFRNPETSPFTGTADVYDLTQLTVADSTRPAKHLVIYEVDRRLRGGEIAPPTRISTS